MPHSPLLRRGNGRAVARVKLTPAPTRENGQADGRNVKTHLHVGKLRHDNVRYVWMQSRKFTVQVGKADQGAQEHLRLHSWGLREKQREEQTIRNVSPPLPKQNKTEPGRNASSYACCPLDFCAPPLWIPLLLPDPSRCTAEITTGRFWGQGPTFSAQTTP